MAAQDWDNAFEAVPAGSANANTLDTVIQALKENIRNRTEKEHAWSTGSPSQSTHGWHREGSAKAYYEASAPTNRPDGSTALSSDDAGRLWLNSGAQSILGYTGSAFARMSPMGSAHLDKSADYTLTDTDPDLVFVTTADTDRTITLPTAADNAGRLVLVKKVDSGTGTVIVDGEGAETIDGATTVTVTDQYGWWLGFCDGVTWHTVSVPLSSGVITTGTGTPTLKCKVLEIGDWNIQSSGIHSVAHGLTAGDIRAVSAVIRNDAGTSYADVASTGNVPNGSVATLYWGSTDINFRIWNSTYTGSTYSSTSYNRGWITIWYEE